MNKKKYFSVAGQPLKVVEVCLIGAVLLLAGCSTIKGPKLPGPGDRTPAAKSAHERVTEAGRTIGERADIEQRWGVRLYSLRRVAAGYMLDLRFQVLDPEKAAPLLLRGEIANPFIIAEKSQAKLAVPFMEKLGSLRQTVRHAAQIKKKRYNMMFANPGGYVKSGEKVTVVIGDFKVEHLTVN